FPVIAEIFAHRTGRIRSDVLHRRGLRSGSGNNNRIVHGAVISEGLHHVGDRRTLLANGAVDTNEVIAFVVDDSVKHDRSFAGLAVSDDEFALATSNRNHRIDGLKTGCHRLPDRLTINYAGSDALDGYVLFCRDRALVVDGVA